jgi:radical SAM superfamily enzyme YgiQ (UPF0313 family)
LSNTLFEFLKKIKYIINDLNPKVIGVSLFSSKNISFSLILLKFIRENFKNIKVIIGGKGCTGNVLPHNKKFHEYCVENLLVDEVELGDSIDKIRNLLNNNTSPSGDFIPDFSDYNLDKYHWVGNKKLPLLTSRGCVRKCEFCDVPFKWPTYTWEEAEIVVEQLVKTPILPYEEGEERVLRGYKVQFTSRDGKYNCIDMDIADTTANVRPVNINSISWIIFNNVKYTVE